MPVFKSSEYDFPEGYFFFGKKRGSLFLALYPAEVLEASKQTEMALLFAFASCYTKIYRALYSLMQGKSSAI